MKPTNMRIDMHSWNTNGMGEWGGLKRKELKENERNEKSKAVKETTSIHK